LTNNNRSEISRDTGPFDVDGWTSSASQKVFYTQKFLSQNLTLFAMLLKH